MAGYSGTPLVKKIGIKQQQRLFFKSAPASFAKDLGPLPDGTELLKAAKPPVDVAVLFVKGRAELEKELMPVAEKIASNGMVWVGWPKKSSGVKTDMTEDVVRAVALPQGLVDVKVCAIDETWSGLKLVWRKEKRAAVASRTS